MVADKGGDWGSEWMSLLKNPKTLPNLPPLLLKIAAIAVVVKQQQWNQRIERDFQRKWSERKIWVVKKKKAAGEGDRRRAGDVAPFGVRQERAMSKVHRVSEWVRRAFQFLGFLTAQYDAVSKYYEFMMGNWVELLLYLKLFLKNSIYFRSGLGSLSVCNFMFFSVFI